MIRCNLRLIMAQRGIRFISQLSRDTGISKTTLLMLYQGKTTGIQFKTADRLCKHLDVGIGELLEYSAETKVENRHRELSAKTH